MLPQGLEDAGLDPFLEAVVSRRTRAETGDIKSFPLAASAEDEENGLHAATVGRPWPATAEGMRVDMLGEKRGNGFPKLIGDAPLIRNALAIHGKPPFSDLQLPIRAEYSCTIFF